MSWMDAVDFNPGYLQRGEHLMPKRADHPDWQHTQDYWHEKDALPRLSLDTEALVYEDANGERVGHEAADAA